MKKKIAILTLIIGALLGLFFTVLWNSTIGIRVESWIYQELILKKEAKIAYEKARQHHLKFGATDFDYAKSYYQRAIELVPNYASAYAGLSEMCCAWFYLSQARGRLSENLKKEAIKHAITAVSVKPRIFESKRAIAFCLTELDKSQANELVEELIDKALSLKQNDKEAKYIKWVSKGKPLDHPFVNEVLNQHDYNFILPMIDIGSVLIDKRDLKRAKQFFHKASTINNECAFAHYGLGSTFTKTELDKAEYHLRKSLELDPQLAKAYHSLGVLNAAKENYKDSISYFEKYYQKSRDITTLGMIGLAYFELGELEKAKKTWEKAREFLRSEEFFSNFGLALYYLSKEDFSKSKSYYLIPSLTRPFISS